MGRPKAPGGESSEEDGGADGGGRRPTRERKQVNYAKLDDVELEDEEENGAAQRVRDPKAWSRSEG